MLTLGARVLALGDYQASQALTQEGPQAQLTGVYRGNATRGTARPTTERMLKAFEHINLLLIPSALSGSRQEACFVTPLSPVQERIVALLGLPTSLYTSLSGCLTQPESVYGPNTIVNVPNLTQLLPKSRLIASTLSLTWT